MGLYRVNPGFGWVWLVSGVSLDGFSKVLRGVEVGFVDVLFRCATREIKEMDRNTEFADQVVYGLQIPKFGLS